MATRRDVIRLLDKGVEHMLEMLPGLASARDNPEMLARLRNDVALSLVGQIAEECADHWDIPALREALADIVTITRRVKDDEREWFDRKVMAEPELYRSLLGLPEDADATEIMRVLAERSYKPPDDRGEREREPVP